MRYGKSLLLGELISAKEVNYEDIRKNHLLIVCPVCYEALFKVVRQTENSGIENPVTHYFSHYEAGRSYVTDCELRVGCITQREIQTLALQSREQKLKHFIARLQTTIHQHFLNYAHSPTIPIGEGHFRQLRHSGTLAWYRNGRYLHFQKRLSNMSDYDILASFDRNIEKLDKDQLQRLTTLGIATQKRIALDLVKHLSIPQARPSFDCLFNHAYTWITISLEARFIEQCNCEAVGIETDLLNHLLPVLKRLPNTSRNRAVRLLEDLGPEPLEVLDHFLFTEMLTILVSLPYIDLLREFLPKQEPYQVHAL